MPAVANFPFNIAAVLGKTYSVISANCCFLKETYGFGTVLKQHATEVSTASDR